MADLRDGASSVGCLGAGAVVRVERVLEYFGEQGGDRERNLRIVGVGGWLDVAGHDQHKYAPSPVDGLVIGSLGWDGQHPGDVGAVLGVVQRGEREQGVDGGEAGVALRMLLARSRSRWSSNAAIVVESGSAKSSLDSGFAVLPLANSGSIRMASR